MSEVFQMMGEYHAMIDAGDDLHALRSLAQAGNWFAVREVGRVRSGMQGVWPAVALAAIEGEERS